MNLNEQLDKIKSMMDLNEGEKKADRCLKIARRRYGKKSSAYRSGAIVQCRRGKIWKGLSEADINEAPEDIKDLIYKAHSAITRTKGNDYAPDVHEIQEYIDDHLEQQSEGMDEAKKTDYSKEKKSGLHGWFSRRGGGGSKGWVDCNTCRKVDGKKKCKACGRQKGETRSKYPSCRPTPASCGTPGKGKKWGVTKESQNPLNENETPKKEVALLMVVKDNKVLLFKRSETDKSNPGKWAMIGGGVDAGETAEQALTREVKEEAGVFLKNFTSLKKYGYGNVILNIFYTNTFDDENIKLNKEHSEYKYFTMEELENEENTIATNIQFVKDYNAVSEKNEKLNEQLNKMRNLL
jgi:mutator protein MutT